MSKRRYYSSSSDDESESDFSEGSYGTAESRRGGSRKKKNRREAPNKTVDAKRKTEKYLVDVYTCPITHELPEDPVIAEVSTIVPFLLYFWEKGIFHSATKLPAQCIICPHNLILTNLCAFV